MQPTMRVIELAEEMQSISTELRNQGHRLRFVPTMGALHIGHGSLILQAASEPINHSAREKGYPNNRHTDAAGSLVDPKIDRPRGSVIIIVSIFVNPKQFNNRSDYANYPSTLAKDLDFCKQHNVDYVFAPSPNEMYSDFNGNASSSCMIEAPRPLDEDLEGKSRPGHFKGMLTVVCKLLNIVKPHESYFGEKDYQQLVLVSRMVRDLNMDVVIRSGPTIRDHDLMPLSSRNVRLSYRERQAASIMYKILIDAKQALESCPRLLRRDIDRILYASSMTTICLNLTRDLAEMIEIDYLELRSSDSFSKVHVDWGHDSSHFHENRFLVSELVEGTDGMFLSARLLLALVVGGVRLLDNIDVKLSLGYIIGGDVR